MDFDNVELFPQYNLPTAPSNCPRPDKDDPIEQVMTFDKMVYVACFFCRVFICPFIERDEVHAPGL